MTYLYVTENGNLVLLIPQTNNIDPVSAWLPRFLAVPTFIEQFFNGAMRV